MALFTETWDGTAAGWPAQWVTATAGAGTVVDRVSGRGRLATGTSVYNSAGAENTSALVSNDYTLVVDMVVPILSEWYVYVSVRGATGLVDANKKPSSYEIRFVGASGGASCQFWEIDALGGETFRGNGGAVLRGVGTPVVAGDTVRIKVEVSGTTTITLKEKAWATITIEPPYTTLSSLITTNNNGAYFSLAVQGGNNTASEDFLFDDLSIDALGTPATQTVTAPLVTSTQTLFGPTVTRGPVTVTLPLVTVTGFSTGSLGTPMAVPAYARNVWDLHSFDGLIFVGHGDTVSNAGPITIYSFDPGTQSFTGEYSAHTEEIGLFRELDGKLHAPDFDQRSGNGGFYRRDAGVWSRQATINSQHAYDMVEFEGAFYVGISSPTNGQFNIQRSTDLGATWTIVSDPVTAYWGRCYTLFVLDGVLYATQEGATEGVVIYEWTGSAPFVTTGKTLATIMPSSGSIDPDWLRMPRFVTFAGKLIYTAGDPTGSQWEPLALYCCDAGLVNPVKITAVPTPYDLLVRGSTVYALTWDGTNIGVWQSSNGTSWSLYFQFAKATFARSFEELDGVWYFGLGTASSNALSGEIYQAVASTFPVVFSPIVALNLLLSIPLVTNTPTVFTPTVTLPGFITLPLVTSTQTLFGPSVSLASGTQTAVLPLVYLSSTDQLLDESGIPILTEDGGAIFLGEGGITVFPFTVAVATGSQAIVLPLVTDGQTLFSPSTYHISVLPLVTNAETVFSPAITQFDPVVLPLVVNTATVFAPSATQTGILVAILPLVSNEPTVFDPSVTAPFPLTVVVPLVTNTIVVFSPAVSHFVIVIFYTFEPPHDEGGPRKLSEYGRRRAGVSRIANELAGHYGAPRSFSVLRIGGTYQTIQGPSVAQINTATEYYAGGHIHEVNATQAAALEAAGYEVAGYP